MKSKNMQGGTGADGSQHALMFEHSQGCQVCIRMFPHLRLRVMISICWSANVDSTHPVKYEGSKMCGRRGWVPAHALTFEYVEGCVVCNGVHPHFRLPNGELQEGSRL